MSDIITDINTVDLTSADYGKDINDRLVNIDNNFKNIIGSDFLRGADGSNTYIVEYALFSSEQPKIYDNVDNDDNNLNLINDIKDTILNVLGIVDDTRRVDLFREKDPKIHLICKTGYINNQGSDKEKCNILLSMMPYTYIDNLYLTEIDNNSTNILDIQNKTATVCYTDGRFHIIDIFPTPYYSGTVNNFCWKINGEKTDIICKGLKGDKGDDGTVLLVQAREMTQEEIETGYIENSLIVTHIMDVDKSGWIELEGNSDAGGYQNLLKGKSVIAYVKQDSDDSGNMLSGVFNGYCGVVYEYDDVENKYIINGKSLINISTREVVLSIVQSMRNLTTEYNTGLFVPVDIPITTNNPMKCHMIWNEPIKASRLGDLHISPLNNYSNPSELYDNKEFFESSLKIDYDNVGCNNIDCGGNIHSQGDIECDGNINCGGIYSHYDHNINLARYGVFNASACVYDKKFINSGSKIENYSNIIIPRTVSSASMCLAAIYFDMDYIYNDVVSQIYQNRVGAITPPIESPTVEVIKYNILYIPGVCTSDVTINFVGANDSMTKLITIKPNQYMEVKIVFFSSLDYEIFISNLRDNVLPTSQWGSIVMPPSHDVTLPPPDSEV